MSPSMASGREAGLVELPPRGAQIDRFVVMAEVHDGKHAAVLQARDRGGSFVALKLATTTLGSKLIEREARLLQTLTEAGPAPRFVASGSAGGQPFCATSWRPGVEVRVVAGELREDEMRNLLALCCRVAKAYVELHSRGTLHGAIHPRHVLVDSDGSVSLVDFSLAASLSDRPPAAQFAARFNSLSAPEQAESVLRAEDLSLTAATEQYSVAALLYLLITGRLYARLRLRRQELARDIIECPPSQLSHHGLSPLREVEEVLARALCKQPEGRYPSIVAFAEALEVAARGGRRPAPARSVVQSVQAPLAGLLQSFRRDAYSQEGLGA